MCVRVCVCVRARAHVEGRGRTLLDILVVAPGGCTAAQVIPPPPPHANTHIHTHTPPQPKCCNYPLTCGCAIGTPPNAVPPAA